MVAALQAPPRVRTTGPRRAPARVVPLRALPDRAVPDRRSAPGSFVTEEVIVVHRQPRPRATRRQRAAIYRRRRLIAAALGLGIVLTAAHAGVALGGSTTTPGRSPHPHVERIVVQRGDTLWSIANRVAPGADPRALVDKLAAELGTSDLQVGDRVAVPVS